MNTSKYSDRELVWSLYGTQGLLFLLTVGLLFFLHDQPAELGEYFQLDFRELFLFGMLPALVVVAVDLLLTIKLPSHLYDDGGINRQIFRSRSFWHIVFLCLLISFVEELLFRGVVQAHIGLVGASIIFALIHVRYLTKPVLFISVVLMSFMIGLLFWWTDNLLVTMTAHFVIDFVLALYIRYIEKEEHA
ncbi:CPBP family intramembrane glutamic endopeptidase [Priestia endophytica]|jgi:membrane protease YdiL (CAAX protease family)|uniref:CAAX prenyl protease 2/Lysostaphin resistance protein A-like domain-containing protein n=1 Tax=Priestia endophytica DSM 13796 TaxID=1121089 RepID=A0A1I5VZW1_9BACI|nr:CPBP family intramembrane glutamic endopeptidase [Priestia endophytica]KAB2493749.1 CPBP family intramembrane metalloprotease [Priestia endophytica]KYG35920.1 CAAX protease [Priestia endophytica]MBG9814864.1 CAAX protease [Priestia endophytica]RAS79725.1 CPBP family intramembrane metalloprotease [Priestia endophytica]RAS88573.1 CPBP family intramembrane metalloprotease [Priestia endophytica]